MRRHPFAMLVVAPAFALLLGCDLQQMTGNVQQQTDRVQNTIQQQAQRVEDTVRRQLNLAGEMELTLDPPLALKACYPRFTPPGENRPAVLQISSYRNEAGESFPSIYLRAEAAESNSPEELAGKTLAAELFVQLEQDGPVLHSPEGAPAQLTISSVSEGVLTAELSPGPLQGSDGAEIPSVGGRFMGSINP